MDAVAMGFLALLLLLLLLSVLYSITARARRFFEELNYLNREIQRTGGGERQYWKHKKRKLWRSVFCFWKPIMNGRDQSKGRERH